MNIRALAATTGSVAALSLTVIGSAPADATPVGPLPKGPTTTVAAKRGSLVAVALPRQRASTGLVWRLARTVDPKILQQTAEADVGSSVVVVFRAMHAGATRVAFALTRGDTGKKAVRAAFYKVHVT